MEQKEVVLREIPVQILNIPDGSVLVLRYPSTEEWTEEAVWYLRESVKRAFEAANLTVPVISIPATIDLAVATHE